MPPVACPPGSAGTPRCRLLQVVRVVPFWPLEWQGQKRSPHAHVLCLGVVLRHSALLLPAFGLS
eukprot:11161790-Prorocentrum_lima.AAC.1